MLRDHRLKSGLTQQALADRVGVDRAYVAMLETGRRRNPSRETLTAIVKALGLSGSESQELFAALGYPASSEPPKQISTSPVVGALSDLLRLPPNSPSAMEKMRDLYKRLSAVLSEQGATQEQKKETRWLQLVTQGYMYSPPEGRRDKPGRTSKERGPHLPRSQKDELRMGDRLRSLLEIFVDGRIHISLRAALAEDLLEFARWRIEKNTGSGAPVQTASSRKKKFQ